MQRMIQAGIVPVTWQHTMLHKAPQRLSGAHEALAPLGAV